MLNILLLLLFLFPFCFMSKYILNGSKYIIYNYIYLTYK